MPNFKKPPYLLYKQNKRLITLQKIASVTFNMNTPLAIFEIHIKHKYIFYIIIVFVYVPVKMP